MLQAAKRFNVRVYGIWIHQDKILVNEEQIRGKQVIKFPGGGLDWGEGTIDCLKREWREELGADIEVLEHFYTTDFFQHSAYDDSQVISIYYLVAGANPEDAITNHVAEERTYWMPLKEVSADIFTLPIDKHVGGMLQALCENGAL
ncbi:MAG: NUDIX domain-containing protein [Sphingobacteriales bacterium]|nr:MAG: NUDIX domain-containing protein [Sphingobacteriales bacterium]